MLLPDLDRLWETFVRIGPCSAATFVKGDHIHVLRGSVVPVIRELQSSLVVDWVSLMIHDDQTFRIGGEPRGHALWHVRLSLHPSASGGILAQHLPAVFERTRLVPRDEVAAIPGLNTSLLKSKSVGDAWGMMGEQTEWLLSVVDLYREDADPAAVARDLRQYAHFFANLTFPEVTSGR